MQMYNPVILKKKGINASPMQMYTGGVQQPAVEDCDPNGLNHGVTLVGFGTDKSVPFWSIRNSWGEMWGEKGYYRIIRGTGACGLNQMVTTATDIKTHGRGVPSEDVVVYV